MKKSIKKLVVEIKRFREMADQCEYLLKYETDDDIIEDLEWHIKHYNYTAHNKERDLLNLLYSKY